MTANAEPRALVIGLDGGTLDLVRPWAEAGELPVLADLMHNGTWGVLRSTVHPVTATAWSTFLTGVNAGRHGVYDFVRRRPEDGRLELTSAATIRSPTLFAYLAAHGRRVVSVNVPFTYPPPHVEGARILGGLPAPMASPAIAHPKHLYDEVRAAVGDYVVNVHNARYRSGSGALERYARDIEASVDLQAAAMRYLLRQGAWDLGLIVFTATDEASHAFWRCMDAADGTPEARYRDVIRRVYRRVDRAIGQLLDDVGEVPVLIMSDHGFGPLRKLVNLNRWLMDAGFLRVREAQGGRSLRRLYLDVLRRGAQFYQRRLPPTVRHRLRRALHPLIGPARERLESDLFQAPIDWSRTRAYSLGTGGSIYINLAGREPFGIVHPGAEYEAVCREIAAALEALEDPETGERIVRRVAHREEIYHGPLLDEAPDLIVLWRDYAYWGRGRYDAPDAPLFQEEYAVGFSDLPLTGIHRLEGMLIAAGPGLAAGRRVEGAHIADLLPTILHLLELPVPEGLDGCVLTELWETPTAPQVAGESPTSEEITTTDSVFTADEARAVEERLRDLGYL